MPEPRNWADLPSEIVHLIYKKIPADRIYVHRFRAVCKNWRFSAPLSDLPPQLPWLIECDSPCQNSFLGPNLYFYSLAGGDTGRIRVHEAYHTMVYYGPGNGYLFVSSLVDNFYLLNPLTGYAISLPKLYDVLLQCVKLKIQSPVVSGSDPMHNWHLVLSRTKRLRDYWRSVILIPDMNDWKYVKHFNKKMPCNTCCRDGKLFVTKGGCSTEVFDAISREKLYEVLPPEDEDVHVLPTYLVESCGEILRVSRYFVSGGTNEAEFPMFDINKLFSERGEEHSWSKVCDIGDQILFLDSTNGFSLRALAGFEGNCIYFFLDDGSTPCRYDIGTKTVEMLSCPFRNCTWFIPNFG